VQDLQKCLTLNKSWPYWQLFILFVTHDISHNISN